MATKYIKHSFFAEYRVSNKRICILTDISVIKFNFLKYRMSLAIPQTAKQFIVYASEFDSTDTYVIPSPAQYNFYDVFLTRDCTIILPQTPDPSHFVNIGIVDNAGFTLTVKAYDGTLMIVLDNQQITQLIYYELQQVWKITYTTDTVSALAGITSIGPGEPVYAGILGSVAQFKGLGAGSFIVITSSPDTVFINAVPSSGTSTATEISLLSSSIGGGVPVYAGPVSGVIDYNSIAAAGSYISVALSGGLITPTVQITPIAQAVGRLATIVGVPSYSVFNNSNNVMSFKSLAAGSNVFILPTTTTLMINSTNAALRNTDISVLSTSIGGGLAVYAGPVTGSIDYNSIASSGSYISVSLSGGLLTPTVQITPIAQAVGNLATIVGVPSYSVFNNSNNVMSFKSLAAGSYISITSNATTLVINNTQLPVTVTDISLLSTSIGGGLPVYAGPVTGSIDYNSISSAGSYISVALSAGLLSPNVNVTAIAQSTAIAIAVGNLATIVGVPSFSVFNNSNGLFTFKSLAAGSYISITSNATTLVINSEQASNPATIVGNPSFSVFNNSNSVFTYKSLAAGSYISITSNDTTLVINNTQALTPITETSIAVLSTSIGGGLPVYAGPVTGFIDYNSIAAAGSYIDISLSAGLLSPNVNVTAIAQSTAINIAVSNLATIVGDPLFSVYNNSNNVMTFKSLAAGSHISITSNDTTLVINGTFIGVPATATEIAVLSTSIGGGVDIYAGQTNTVIAYNSLAAGSFINLNITGGLISINAESVGNQITIVGDPLYSVFNNSNGVLTFKSLAAGSHISITSNDTTLVINGTFIGVPATVTEIAVLSTSIGGGLDIYAGPVSGFINYNSLSSNGSYISVSLSAGLLSPNVNVTAIAQSTAINIAVSNLATIVGDPLYSVYNNSNNVMTFKSLAAGSHISITSNDTTLVINGTFIGVPATATEIAVLSTSIGSGLAIYAGQTNTVIAYNSLAAGSFINLNITEGLISINAESIGNQITIVGDPLYSVYNNSNNVMTFKSLAAGSHISITSNDTTLVINGTFIGVPATATEIAVLSTSIGSGLAIYAGQTNTVIAYNSLAAGSFINLNITEGLISINAESVGNQITIVGDPLYSVYNNSNGVLTFKSLAAGSHISITSNDTTLVINGTFIGVPATATEIAVLSTSIGGGVDIYAGQTNTVIAYNSLAAGSFINLNITGGLISINAESIGNQITIVGDPLYSVFNNSNGVLTFKSLAAGSHISITSNDTTLVINGTFIGVPATVTEIAVLSTSIGGGLPVYAGPVSGFIDYNSISSSGSYISVALSAGLLSPNVNVTAIAQSTAINIAVANLATIVGIPSFSVYNNSNNVMTYKSLAAGTFISITSNETTLVINNTQLPVTVTDISLLSTSIGGGLPVYAGPVTGSIDYNSIASTGSYIAIALSAGLLSPNVNVTAIAQSTAIAIAVGNLATIVGVPSFSVFNNSNGLFTFKSIAAGTFISITSNATTLVINNTQSSTSITETSISLLSTSIGGGLPVYAGPVTGSIDYNSISSSGSYISVALSAGLLTPNVNVTAIAQSTAINIAVGNLATIVGNPSFSVFNNSNGLFTFKSLAAGSYVSITSNETTLVVNSTNVVQSAGAGITIDGNGVISTTTSSLSVLTISVFTSNGTWVKLSNAQVVDVLLIGGGGGGGSGARATASGSTGGAGGNPGNVFFLKKYYASLLATHISVTVGTGGAGGGIQTNASTGGLTGVAGNQSVFGTFIALGGFGGGGGFASATASVANTVVYLDALYNATSDAYTQITGLKAAGSNGNADDSVSYFNVATGGGAGSSFFASGFTAAVSSGYIYNPFLGYATAIAAIVNQTGAPGVTYNSYYGTGGAGGQGTGIAGGLGGLYGGGGGGGGAGINVTHNSGAGGNGATGVVVVTTYG